jgi:F0F1-type ATP synthase membrane subunit b/b'
MIRFQMQRESKRACLISPFLFESAKRVSAVVFLVGVTLVVNSANASASPTEGHTPSVWELRFLWLNFFLYVGILYVLLRRPLSSAWAARRQRIERSVVSATSDMEAAEKELRAIEELVRNLKVEQERAREELLAITKQEAAAICAEAQERAERIRSQAKDLLKGEARSAEASFRGQLVARAVELAKAKFSSGRLAERQDSYVAAAVERAKRLVQ